MTGDEIIIFDVNEDDFQERVVAASAEHLVVVDFWAPWCAPCRILTPILERIVVSYGGKVLLAKLNVTENQYVATRWGIRGIPAVKVFKGGKVVSEFVGAYPESEIRRRLATIMPSGADEFIRAGDSLLQKGAMDAAEAKYQEALRADAQHPAAHLQLAELSARKGDIDKARQLASAIEESSAEYPEASNLLTRLDFVEHCKKAGGREACADRITKEPDNLDARYDFATCLAAEGKYRNALYELLSIVEKNKDYRDGAARKAMLRIFSILGEESEFIDEYRSRLSMILFS